MKLRNLLLGGVASLGLVSGFAGVTQAAPMRPNAAVVSAVDLKMVLGSKVSPTGAFELEILAGPGSHGVCHFYLYRNTNSYGWQLLGYFSGTTTTDTIAEDFSFTYYEMIPYSCSGVAGTPAYSVQFYPRIQDYAWFTSVSGSWGLGSSKNDYLNDVFYTTGRSAAAQISDDCSYNDGIEIGTGPQGGIGTVYVNGVKMSPTINFYSKSVSGGKVEFKFGTASDSCNTIEFVATGKGKGGGYDMYLNAMVQALYPTT
jgi:hypothetical protein